MNFKAIEKVVESIQLSLFKKANDSSTGALKSHFRGSGLQFRDHQVYTHGDDVRFIDWKILARTNQTYIKTFEEERNINIAIVLDLSLSMLLGFEGITKLQAGLEITFLLILLAEKTKDHVTLFLVSDSVIVLPKISGKKGLIYLVNKLENLGVLTKEGRINLAFRSRKTLSPLEIMKSLMPRLHRQKEVVLLSDFFTFLDENSLIKLSAQKRLHAFHISSPFEQESSSNYNVYAHSTVSSKKSLMVNFSKKERISKKKKGKIKELSLAEPYLDNFVRDML